MLGKVGKFTLGTRSFSRLYRIAYVDPNHKTCFATWIISFRVFRPSLLGPIGKGDHSGLVEMIASFKASIRFYLLLLAIRFGRKGQIRTGSTGFEDPCFTIKLLSLMRFRRNVSICNTLKESDHFYQARMILLQAPDHFF